MTRTTKNELRAAGLFVVLVLVLMTLICAGFLVAQAVIPDWFVVVGRWLPALVCLPILLRMRLEGGISTWWALRPGGWRRLLGGGLASVLALLVVYSLAALITVLFGLAQLQPGPVLRQVAVILLPTILLFSLSTFGEEVAWRGFLQRALSGWGFWRSSCAISAVWVLFHVPLHGVMALQGTLPWSVAILSTVGLFPLGLFLSAVVIRFGSVWPAIFAHALPLTALNLLQNAGDLTVPTQALVAGFTAVFLLVTAFLFAPRNSSTNLVA